MKILKIIYIIIFFLAVDFLATFLTKIDNNLAPIFYLLSGLLIILLGFYFLKRKDVYSLKIYFFLIITLEIINIFYR